VTAKIQYDGWHKALDWTASDVLFLGFYCEKCHQRTVTPLLKDIGRAYPCLVRHCGREERVTVGELLNANLPTVRTEPHHLVSSGVITINGNNLMPVGDFGDGDSGIKYDGQNAGPKETEDPNAQLDGQLF
jgi:hypothetical protein